GFLRFYTPVFPCTSYCISSAYWLSQHMAFAEPGPSVAVPQPSLPCTVTAPQWYGASPVALKPNAPLLIAASCSMSPG
ncbi:hypothetical protein, partial [Sphingobacterium sp. UBA5670]|uniref:hypothetical protein n=1 Tax=Sphingobacterium sp. UBA5670 TaxID=1947502 RepID=UPI0025D4370E